MPSYECNEHQFVENIRRAIEANAKIIVNRRVIRRDDGRYGLSHLPDREFNKYRAIARRLHQRGTVSASKSFYDDFHHRLYQQDSILHSGRYQNSPHLSIPYVSVEYSFTLWGETYKHEFDVLFEPDIRLERREVRFTETSDYMKAERSGLVLVYTLSFTPPDDRMLRIELPSSVIVFDVRRMIRV